MVIGITGTVILHTMFYLLMQCNLFKTYFTILPIREQNYFFSQCPYTCLLVKQGGQADEKYNRKYWYEYKNPRWRSKEIQQVPNFWFLLRISCKPVVGFILYPGTWMNLSIIHKGYVWKKIWGTYITLKVNWQFKRKSLDNYVLI